MTRNITLAEHHSESLQSRSTPAIDRRHLLGVAAGIAVLAARGPHAFAQADPSMPPGSVGITVEALGNGQPTLAPGYALGLIRLTWESGATLNTHRHAGASLLYIESGAMTYTLLEGTATVSRAAEGDATPGGAAATEPMSAGEEVVLEAGDTLFEDADVVHTARNAGDAPIVVLIANLISTDEPAPIFMEEATPAQ